MPTAPKHACGKSGCPTLVDRGHARCPAHQVAHMRASEARRGTAHSRGYDARWAKARLLHLGANPLCVRCLAAGRVTAGRVVDHIIAHRGDQRLFWDETNWQTLCDFTSPYNCHGAKSDEEERGANRPRASK